MPDENDDLDAPIYTAERIGREARLFHPDGRVNIQATYDALEKGYLDGSKFGKKWVTADRSKARLPIRCLQR
jgi:hypothetical protein